METASIVILGIMMIAFFVLASGVFFRELDEDLNIETGNFKIKIERK